MIKNCKTINSFYQRNFPKLIKLPLFFIFLLVNFSVKREPKHLKLFQRKAYHPKIKMDGFQTSF